jgi:hypothetical protein
VSLICPHCNAINADTTGHEFADCSRCGERFRMANAQSSVLPSRKTPTPVAANPPGFLYSRAAVYLSFALSAVILVSGLAIVRPWESRPIPEKSKPPVVVSPLGLSGLVYFPPSTNILVAIQPLPLLAYSARTKTDPRKFLIEAGVPDSLFGILDRAKIPLDQIDHFLVGLSVSAEEGKVLPGITAFLKLTRPIADETNFLAQLKAEKNSQQSKGGRTVYSFNAGLPLLLRKLDAQTYLFGFSEEDLAMIEKPAASGGGHLPKELRDAMTARIDPTSFAWFATDTDNWPEKPGAKFLALNPAWKARLSQISAGRAIAGGVALDAEPTLRFAVRLKDESDAAEFRGWLQNKLPGDRTSIGGKESWATAETAFDPKESGIKALLGELMNGK